MIKSKRCKYPILYSEFQIFHYFERIRSWERVYIRACVLSTSTMMIMLIYSSDGGGGSDGSKR